MNKICNVCFLIFNTIMRVFNRLVFSPFKKALCASCGKNVIICRNCKLTWSNVYIGNDVSINENALFLCTRANVIIGDHVIFGPRVTVITGNHRTDIIGRYMSSILDTEKRLADDEDVIFEGDNWIGANATILKGVTIGVGSIVACGAVVTKNVPPYSIVAGVPAKVIAKRFSDEQIKEHERIVKDVCQ